MIRPEVTAVLIIGILIYLLFGIMSNRKDRSLTLHIFIEYLLTAALVLVLVMGVQSL